MRTGEMIRQRMCLTHSIPSRLSQKSGFWTFESVDRGQAGGHGAGPHRVTRRPEFSYYRVSLRSQQEVGCRKSFRAKGANKIAGPRGPAAGEGAGPTNHQTTSIRLPSSATSAVAVNKQRAAQEPAEAGRKVNQVRRSVRRGRNNRRLEACADRWSTPRARRFRAPSPGEPHRRFVERDRAGRITLVRWFAAAAIQ